MEAAVEIDVGGNRTPATPWFGSVPVREKHARDFAETSRLVGMSGTKERHGLQREIMRDRLRALGVKARHDARSLTLQEIDELCTLVAQLTPAPMPGPPPTRAQRHSPYEPIAPDAPGPETGALLRQTQAMEHMAAQIGHLVRLIEDEVLRDRRFVLPRDPEP